MIEHVRAGLVGQRRGLHPGPAAADVGALRPGRPIRAVPSPIIGTARSTRSPAASLRGPAPLAHTARPGASGGTVTPRARRTVAFPTTARGPSTRPASAGPSASSTCTRTRTSRTRIGGAGASPGAPRPLLAVLASLGAVRRG
ncbi:MULTISPECIES: hypothetical protein [Frankia]|uniref:hypothetical protein n=1 Tax=Frankia TaxID=1854 RepID=UPI0005A50CC2|nr:MULTISPECIES: hypothetical protein [Frankia]